MKRWLVLAMVVLSVVAAARADERKGGDPGGLITGLFVCSASGESTLPGFEGPFAAVGNVQVNADGTCLIAGTVNLGGMPRRALSDDCLVEREPGTLRGRLVAEIPGSPFTPAENAYAIVSEDEIVFIGADELVIYGSCKRVDPKLVRHRKDRR